MLPSEMCLLIGVLHSGLVNVDSAADLGQFRAVQLRVPLDRLLVEVLVHFLRPLHVAEELEVLVPLGDAARDAHRAPIVRVVATLHRRCHERAVQRGGSDLRIVHHCVVPAVNLVHHL